MGGSHENQHERTRLLLAAAPPFSVFPGHEKGLVDIAAWEKAEAQKYMRYRDYDNFI
jgi:hypothetical protein